MEKHNIKKDREINLVIKLLLTLAGRQSLELLLQFARASPERSPYIV